MLVVEEGMEGWEVGLLSFGMFTVGVLTAGGAFGVYVRRKKQDSPLVTGDHLQSNFNPGAAKPV